MGGGTLRPWGKGGASGCLWGGGGALNRGPSGWVAGLPTHQALLGFRCRALPEQNPAVACGGWLMRCNQAVYHETHLRTKKQATWPMPRRTLDCAIAEKLKLLF